MFTMEMESKKFNQDIKKFIKRSNLSTNIIIKKIAFDLLARILRASSVDTGRSRAGWYAAIQGLGGSFELESKVKNPAKSQVSKGKKESAYKEHLGNSVNKYVELINGVDYVIYLEYGWSKQAPMGMIRISMRKMRGKMPKKLSKEFKKDWNKRV